MDREGLLPPIRSCSVVVREIPRNRMPFGWSLLVRFRLRNDLRVVAALRALARPNLVLRPLTHCLSLGRVVYIPGCRWSGDALASFLAAVCLLCIEPFPCVLLGYSHAHHSTTDSYNHDVELKRLVGLGCLRRVEGCNVCNIQKVRGTQQQRRRSAFSLEPLPNTEPLIGATRKDQLSSTTLDDA